MRRIEIRQCHDELTLKDALSDPLIRAVMDADGVDPRELATTLSGIARLRRARQERPAIIATAPRLDQSACCPDA